MVGKNIRVHLSILLIGLASVHVEGNILTEHFAPCPEVCPASYSPVCASDGIGYTEFSNDCMLQATNCRFRNTDFKVFSKTDMDWCTTQYFESFDALPDIIDMNRPECARPCTMLYEPLCVSNGKYRTQAASQCVLDMYNCGVVMSGSRLIYKVLKEGVC